MDNYALGKWIASSFALSRNQNIVLTKPFENSAPVHLSIWDDQEHGNLCYPQARVWQGAGKQGIEILPLEILPVEIQAVENQGQLNTKDKIQRNQILSDQVSINQSPSDSETVVENVERQTDGSTDGYISEKRIYTEVVKANIDFDYFAAWLRDEEEAEEIVQMMVRQICSRKKTERICGEDYPREIVKSAMLKVDVSVLQNALEQIRHTDGVQNFERYLISTLFNEANGKRFKENATDRWADYAVKRDFGGLYGD